MLVVIISPGGMISTTAAVGVSRATWPIAVVQPGALGLFLGYAVGEGAALACCVVGVLVPGAFGIKEPVELLLVEGGALLRLIGDGDNVVVATLAFAGLGGVGAIAVLAVPGWSIAAWTCRVVILWGGRSAGSRRSLWRRWACSASSMSACLLTMAIMSEMVLGLLSNIFLHSSMLWRPWWKRLERDCAR